METSTRHVSLSREPAEKRCRVVTTIRLGKDSRSAPRGETPGGESDPDDLIQQDELMSDDVDSDDDGSGVLGTLLCH